MKYKLRRKTSHESGKRPSCNFFDFTDDIFSYFDISIPPKSSSQKGPALLGARWGARTHGGAHGGGRARPPPPVGGPLRPFGFEGSAPLAAGQSMFKTMSIFSWILSRIRFQTFSFSPFSLLFSPFFLFLFPFRFQTFWFSSSDKNARDFLTSCKFDACFFRWNSMRLHYVWKNIAKVAV